MHHFPVRNAPGWLRSLWLLAATSLPASPLLAQVPNRQALEKEFDERLKKCNPDSIDDLLEVATWADAQGIKDKAKLIYLRVIRKDTNNEEARLALGHVKTGKGWVTAEEAEELRKAGKLTAPAAGGAAAGGGGGGGGAAQPTPAAASGWQPVAPPSDEEIRNAVKETMGANEKVSATKITRYVNDLGVDKDAFSAGRSQHLFVLAKATPLEVENLLTIAETVYARLNCLVYGKAEANTFRQSVPTINYYVEGNAYRDTLDFIAKEHPDALKPDEAKRVFREAGDTKGYSSILPVALHVAARSEAPGALQSNRSNAANSMGHHWLYWSANQCITEQTIQKKDAKGNTPTRTQPGQGYSLLTWLGEGVGIWASKELLGTNLTYRTTKSIYAGGTGKAEKGKDPDSMYLELCYEHAVGKEKNPRSFYELTKTELNQLDDRALAMAWSIVDYLIKTRPEQFSQMIKGGGRISSFRKVFIDVFGDDKQREARNRPGMSDLDLDDLFRNVCTKVEDDWKAWVKNESDYKLAYDSPGKRKPKPKPMFPGDTEGGDKDGGEKPPAKKPPVKK